MKDYLKVEMDIIPFDTEDVITKSESTPAAGMGEDGGENNED